jgi:hypothetical protein
MKGFCFSSAEGNQYRNYCSQDNTISSRIRRVFKGPPKPTPPPQPETKRKYTHKPTHSASSFIKTTTTAPMIDAQVEQEARLDEKTLVDVS